MFRLFQPCYQTTQLLLLMAVILFTVPVFAQVSSRVRIAVLPHTSDSNVATERKAWIERLLHWSMRQQEGIHILPQTEIEQKLLAQGASMTAADQARIRVLQTFLQKAKKLYQLRRYDFTIKALEIADKVAAKVRIHLTQPDLIRELYLYRALAYMGLRDGLKTREYVMRTIQFDSNYQPPSEGIPTAFLNYYQVLRQWVLRRPTYNMVINTVPPGAKIYLNLQPQGTSPTTLTVVPGQHLLRLEKTGYTHWERVANLSPERLGNRRSISVSVPLEKDPNTLSLDNIPLFAKGADIDDNILDRLEKICERLAIQHLYVTAIHQKERYFLRIASYRKSSRKIEYKLVDIGISRPEHRQSVLAYAQNLGRQIAPVVVRRPPPVERPRPRPRPQPVEPDDDTPRRIEPVPVARREPEPPPRRRVAATNLVRPSPEPEVRTTPPAAGSTTPFYQTWWFWTVTIGVTAAIGVTVAVIVTQTAPPPTTTLIITTENPERGN